MGVSCDSCGCADDEAALKKFTMEKYGFEGSCAEGASKGDCGNIASICKVSCDSCTPATPPPTPAPAMGPLPIGAEVALHSSIHNKFMRLHSNGNMDGSGHMAMNDLPAYWTWERFFVVDGGNGQIALWSASHNRFVRMNANENMDGSEPMGRDMLPAHWTWERFSVVDAGNGQIALHSPIHNRFVRLNANGNMDTTPPTNKDALPADWTWERWSVKITIPAPGHPTRRHFRSHSHHHHHHHRGQNFGSSTLNTKHSGDSTVAGTALVLSISSLAVVSVALVLLVCVMNRNHPHQRTDHVNQRATRRLIITEGQA